jgi:predicted RNA-binding Zn-ribbon protein involved in translation (DUF1610 family)
MHCTEIEVFKARKVHICLSCGERIEVGQEYKRWRCYDGGDAGTVKMHPECHKAHSDNAAGAQWEFTPYSYPRGQAEQ